MKKINDGSFKVRKKISLDINKEFLQDIDGLASLTKSNRTLVIESLLGKGMLPFLTYLEDTWKRFLSEGRYKEKKEGLEKALNNLKKIKEKYLLLDPKSLKEFLSKKNLNEKKKKEIIKFLNECDFP